MDWRDEYDAAIAERNRLIMALTAAEKRAEAAERRVAELEARLESMKGRAVTKEWPRVGEMVQCKDDGIHLGLSVIRVINDAGIEEWEWWFGAIPFGEIAHVGPLPPAATE